MKIAQALNSSPNSYKSSSEESIEILPRSLRPAVMKKQTSAKDTNTLHARNGSTDGSAGAGFSRPRKSVDQVTFAHFGDFKEAEIGNSERDDSSNQKPIGVAELKSVKSSQDISGSGNGNPKLKRFESNAKMTFETRIQKAKYTSSITVGSKLKELKQGENHERVNSTVPDITNLDSEVDDVRYNTYNGESRDQRRNRSEDLSNRSAYPGSSNHSQPTNLSHDFSGAIDENEVEWLRSATGMTREQAVEMYLTKNRAASQQTVVRSDSPSVFDKIEVTLNDKRRASTHSSNSKSALEMIFGSVSNHTDEFSKENVVENRASTKPAVIANHIAERNVRNREPLTLLSSKTVPTLSFNRDANTSAVPYSTTRINSNRFNVEAVLQQAEYNSSPNTRFNEMADPIEVVNPNRQEFYENFDKQVNLLMKKGFSREDAFQLQLKSQNLDPNIPESNIDDSPRVANTENVLNQSDALFEEELLKLMDLGMTGEQAEMLLQNRNQQKHVRLPTPPIVTKIAVREAPVSSKGAAASTNYLFAEEPGPEVDEEEPIDEYQAKLTLYMQRGFTQEQAELAINLESKRSQNNSIPEPRSNHHSDHLVDRSNAHKMQSSFDGHSNHHLNDSNGYQASSANKGEITNGTDSHILDANDESEIAVLVARGYTRAEAILSIMAADEAEAMILNNNKLNQQYASSLPTHLGNSNYAASNQGLDSETRHLGEGTADYNHYAPYPPPPLPSALRNFSRDSQLSLRPDYSDYNHYGAYSAMVQYDVPPPPQPQSHFAPPSLPQPLPVPNPVPVPPASINIGTYFKATNPDDEALELAVLLSHQEAVFGVNMFDSLRAEDNLAINSYIAMGYTFNDAVLDIFERKHGTSRPLAPLQPPMSENYTYSNQMAYTYPGRGFNAASQPMPRSNNSVADISAHRRNISTPTFFSNNSSRIAAPSSDSYFYARRVPAIHNGRTTLSSAATVGPATTSRFSSNSSAASVPLPRAANNSRLYGNAFRTTSSASVPGNTRNRSPDRSRRVANNGLDVVPPYIHTYPPPELPIDTEWRRALKVEKCRKSSVKALMKLGFSEEHAVQALLETNHHVDHAVQLLLRTRA